MPSGQASAAYTNKTDEGFLGKTSNSEKAGGKTGVKPRSSPAPRAAGRPAAPARLQRARSVSLELADPVVGSEGAPAQAIPLARLGWREAVERTVTGMGYEVVDVERALRGLLRVTIDRVPGRVYPSGESEFVLVEDCEAVTRQLQYALEVDGVDYARLEVSSPGLDRPIRSAADYARFSGEEVSVTLKLPFQGRKVFKGLLGRGEAVAGQDGEQDTGWTLVFHDGKNEQVLAFTLDEVREARLVPVVNFKGRQGKAQGAAPEAAAPALDGGQGR
jgi:ribosome maturation factor RimP